MKQRKRYLAISASLALALALLWVLPSLAASVTRKLETLDGNVKCEQYDGVIGFKPQNIDHLGENTPDGQYIYTVYGMGTVTVTVTNADAEPSAPFITWSSSFGILKVIVKAGDYSNVYTYDPASYEDTTGLTTPTNPQNDKPYGLSHVEFCYNDKQAVLADYGDLPNEYGITQLGENGARHIPIANNDVILGSLRDSELNGTPNGDATGDDIGNDDEDGVERWPSWGGESGRITVTVSGPSCLMGWVDWAKVDSNNFVDIDHDFEFSEGFMIGNSTYTEKVIDNIYLPSGTHTLNFALPPDFDNATVFARFRLVPDLDNDGDCSDQTAIGLTGLAEGGEVEDYLWNFGTAAVELKKLSAVSQPSTASLGLLGVGFFTTLTALWFGRRRPQ